MIQKIKDYPHLIKENGAILNTDKEQYRAALQRQQKSKQVEDFNARLTHVENTLSEILTLLKEKL